MKIPLVGNSFPAFSPAISEQASINCYTETVEVPGGEKSKTVLRGAPGTVLFKTLTAIDAAATPVRGIWSGGGRCFVVAGTTYFEISSAGALIGSVYTVATDASNSPVQIFANGNQLFIVSAGLAYCDNGSGPVQVVLPSLSGTAHINPSNNYQLLWDSGDQFDIGMLGQTVTWNGTAYTVASITNPSLITLTTAPTPSGVQAFSATVVLGASSGTFIDGFFVVSRPASRQFNISAQLDGTSWDPLDFGLKEGYPDNLVAVYAENELLYLFGTETMEAWRNVGAADFPFQRVDGYSADLKYDPEKINATGLRVGADLKFAGDDYNVIAIDENEVILLAQSNQKKYTLRYTP